MEIKLEALVTVLNIESILNYERMFHNNSQLDKFETWNCSQWLSAKLNAQPTTELELELLREAVMVLFITVFLISSRSHHWHPVWRMSELLWPAPTMEPDIASHQHKPATASTGLCVCVFGSLIHTQTQIFIHINSNTMFTIASFF